MHTARAGGRGRRAGLGRRRAAVAVLWRAWADGKAACCWLGASAMGAPLEGRGPWRTAAWGSTHRSSVVSGTGGMGVGVVPLGHAVHKRAGAPCGPCRQEHREAGLLRCRPSARARRRCAARLRAAGCCVLRLWPRDVDCPMAWAPCLSPRSPPCRADVRLPPCGGRRAVCAG